MPAVVPAARVQLAEVGLNVPVEFVVKPTVPVGVVGIPDVSVTVTAHAEDVLTCTDPGEHWTLVLVEWGAGVAARANVP